MQHISTANITRSVFALSPQPALPSVALGGPSSWDVQVQDLRIPQGQRTLILDVRTPEGHLPGTKLLPLGDLSQRAAEVPASQTVDVICHRGRRIALPSQILVRAGKRDDRHVLSGLPAWQSAGYSVICSGERP
ncbi:rhodanese-like domain-containing protein [Deinococcus ruber]|uniref:Rhodanese domain-containing protein n=1 Tax=Deinococcus ruber TaxID=1848197 RepID=A0A918C6S8_9DEIO|nr:hypothetical protein GCM10008957_22870 [Deinococcus ruber]